MNTVNVNVTTSGMYDSADDKLIQVLCGRPEATLKWYWHGESQVSSLRLGAECDLCASYFQFLGDCGPGLHESLLACLPRHLLQRLPSKLASGRSQPLRNGDGPALAVSWPARFPSTNSPRPFQL